MKYLKFFEGFINEGYEVYEGFNFYEDAYDYNNKQTYLRCYMLDLSTHEELAYAEYVKYEGKIYIHWIESLVKDYGYGQTLMKYLSKIYGYENIERSGLTPDGVEMRKKLDKHFNFDYEKYKDSLCKHYDRSILDKIKDPIVKGFLTDIVDNGYEYAWDKWLKNEEFKKLGKNKYDFNDISIIANRIKGSKTNDNLVDDLPGEYVEEELNKLIN